MSVNLINYALAKKDWKKAYEDLKVLEIGGRNLILDSDKEYSSTGIVFFADILESHRPLVEGETYTLSFDLKADEYTTSNRIFLNNSIVIHKTFEFPTEWKRQYVTFIYKADDFQGKQIFPHFYPSGDMRKYARRFKLEKGDRATDWTPAPEDIDAHPFVVELAETVFRSKQQDWEKAYEDLKVLGVGGRNLIPNTSDKNKTVSWSDWDYHLINVPHIEDIGLSVGDPLVFRLYIEETNAPVRAFVQFELNDGSGIRYRQKNGNIIYEGESGWSEVKFTISEEDVRDLQRFTVAIRNMNRTNATVTYRKAKLEIGNEATDWTPALEDTDAHPFVVELAETVFRSKQNEERIKDLENAITALGLEEKSISN